MGGKKHSDFWFCKARKVWRDLKPQTLSTILGIKEACQAECLGLEGSLVRKVDATQPGVYGVGLEAPGTSCFYGLGYTPLAYSLWMFNI